MFGLAASQFSVLYDAYILRHGCLGRSTAVNYGPESYHTVLYYNTVPELLITKIKLLTA